MSPLGREIGAALLFKAVALAILYLAFFGGSHHADVTPSHMAAFLFGGSESPAPSPPNDRNQ